MRRESFDVPKRHSLHEVGMLHTSVQMVSTQPDSVFWASRPSLPAACLALLLTKAGDVESYTGPTTHTNKHTPVIWICDLCHKQIKKQQTSIICNHTHNIHWVHLNGTQRQYKPDWRCTIHTPTQIVTTTPSRDNKTTHRRQITTQPLTDNNKPKNKNKLQININGIRNKFEELKTSYTAPNHRTSTQPSGIHTLTTIEVS